MLQEQAPVHSIKRTHAVRGTLDVTRTSNRAQKQYHTQHRGTRGIKGSRNQRGRKERGSHRRGVRLCCKLLPNFLVNHLQELWDSRSPGQLRSARGSANARGGGRCDARVGIEVDVATEEPLAPAKVAERSQWLQTAPDKSCRTLTMAADCSHTEIITRQMKLRTCAHLQTRGSAPHY